MPYFDPLISTTCCRFEEVLAQLLPPPADKADALSGIHTLDENQLRIFRKNLSEKLLERFDTAMTNLKETTELRIDFQLKKYSAENKYIGST